jgi:hypothetical protein
VDSVTVAVLANNRHHFHRFCPLFDPYVAKGLQFDSLQLDRINKLKIMLKKKKVLKIILFNKDGPKIIEKIKFEKVWGIFFEIFFFCEISDIKNYTCLSANPTMSLSVTPLVMTKFNVFSATIGNCLACTTRLLQNQRNFAI